MNRGHYQSTTVDQYEAVDLVPYVFGGLKTVQMLFQVCGIGLGHPAIIISNDVKFVSIV